MHLACRGGMNDTFRERFLILHNHKSGSSHLTSD